MRISENRFLILTGGHNGGNLLAIGPKSTVCGGLGGMGVSNNADKAGDKNDMLEGFDTLELTGTGDEKSEPTAYFIGPKASVTGALGGLKVTGEKEGQKGGNQKPASNSTKK